MANSIPTQPLDSDLAAIAALNTDADKLPYFTGVSAAALADFTAAGRALVAGADAAAQRATLGLGTAATADTTDFVPYSGAVADVDLGERGLTAKELSIDVPAGTVGRLKFKDGGVDKWDWRKTAANFYGLYNYNIAGFNIFFDPSGAVNLPQLTASTALALDASKNIVSVSNTGTGNNVLATSPILVTPNIGAATGTSLSVTGNISAGGYFEATKSSPGSTVAGYITHTNNTDGNSNALFSISSGGANGGDATLELNNQVAGSAIQMTLDNSDNDVFKMRRAGNNFLTATLGGAVDLPAQPLFMARRTTNAVNVTGTGTSWTAVFNGEIFDVGNVFSGSTTFTAPITSNRFYFNINLNFFDLTTSNFILVQLVTSNYTYRLFDQQATPSSSQQILNLSVSNVQMDLGDTATVQIVVAGSGSNNIDVLGDATTLIRTYFSGGLL